MKMTNHYLRGLFYSLPLLVFGACGIVSYPGQPGMVTSNYVKIDLEDLQYDGLYVYETIYDNQKGGQGVGAIVTKSYPKAQTYTSNVRTNADGTLFRSKAQYNGAEVQMIAIPSLNQVMISPGSSVALFLEYKTSLDEIDEKNAAEMNIFKPTGPELPLRALEMKKMRWDMIRAGSLTGVGSLSYEVTALDLKETKFTPAKPVKFETTFFQNAVKSDVTPETKREFLSFLEANYPKGFSGTVNVHVKGSPNPLPVQLGLHTLKTLEASGTKIIKTNLTQETVDEVVRRFKAGTLKEMVSQ